MLSNYDQLCAVGYINVRLSGRLLWVNVVSYTYTVYRQRLRHLKEDAIIPTLRSLLTNNQTTPRKGWPHHRGLRPLLLSNSGVSSFTSQKHQISEIAQCQTGPTVFLFYPRKLSRKSKRLQIPLQRQHFIVSYFKTLKVVCPAGVS